MEGGISDSDPTSEMAVSTLKQAVTEYNKSNNKALEFVRIENLTTQVVAGMMYRGVVVLSEGGSEVKYSFQVWAKVAGQGIEIKKFEQQ